MEITTDLLKRIERVNVYIAAGKDGRPHRLMCYATVDGKFRKPREVSRQQMQVIQTSGNDYLCKVSIAADIYADVLAEREEEYDYITA